MTIYYSKTTKGFYDTDINGTNIPDDSVIINKEYHEELICNQGGDKIICPDENGHPILIDKSVSPEETNAFREKSRLKAYASESDPLFFKFQRGEGTREEWISKIDEIKQRFPYI